MKDSQILKCARDYISSNLTVEEVANRNNVTKKTLQNNFKKLKEINYEVYAAVELKKEKNQAIGKIKGGKTGKRTGTHSKEEINDIAVKFIDKQMTFKEGEASEEIASSTLHDMLHSNLVDDDKRAKLDEVAKANKRFMTVEELEESKKNGK